MSLTVIKRPQGYVLDSTQVTGVTVSDNSPDAIFTKNSHGLNTGDFIYIYSTFSSYNGYWYVIKSNVNNFFIREYSSATNIAFIPLGTATYTITYYKSVLTHNWNCVHLPIVYKLKSDIWPTNGSDIARSITTFSNYNGYTYINASGDIKTTGTASAFEQVILSGTSVDGVYKIIQWFSDTNFVINLPYSAGNVLSSGTVQYYYFNYCARIKIYAGLSSFHPFNTIKPTELITEIKLIPDSSGIITLNISEFIKSKIEIISNNSLLDSYPCNIDAWTNFYITYAESYDDSNMYTVSEYVSSYTSDSPAFGSEYYAINAKLPFKTQSQGTLSKYIYGGTSATQQLWLTDFTRPTLFPGKYFDVSYINNTGTSQYIKRDLYRLSNGNYSLISSIRDTVSSSVYGINRYAISQSINLEDRIDITIYDSSDNQLSTTMIIDVNNHCSFNDFYLVWLNYLGGYNYWNFNAKKGKKYSIDILENKTQDVNIYNNWPNSYGEFADSITKQTKRRSKNKIALTSQLLTSAQEDAIKLITSSPLVQICTSQYDRQTVLVSNNSLYVRQDKDKSLSISLSISYTDEIPSQSL